MDESELGEHAADLEEMLQVTRAMYDANYEDLAGNKCVEEQVFGKSWDCRSLQTAELRGLKFAGRSCIGPLQDAHHR